MPIEIMWHRMRIEPCLVWFACMQKVQSQEVKKNRMFCSLCFPFSPSSFELLPSRPEYMKYSRTMEE